jgi:nucleotide-binding universal stress UspA family protein
MKKLMIAVDDTQGSLDAVAYVARHFGELRGLEVTLFHVLPGLPSRFWDDGHILSAAEKAARETVVTKWQANQKPMLDELFRKAAAALNQGGIGPDRVKTKSTLSEHASVAEAILDEARAGGYDLLVIGRVCRHSPARQAILGDNTTAIIHRGAGVPVCVVE